MAKKINSEFLKIMTNYFILKAGPIRMMWDEETKFDLWKPFTFLSLNHCVPLGKFFDLRVRLFILKWK